MSDEHARTRAGLLLGLGAYLLWGVLPLYFKAIAHVAPSEIVAHRIVWSLLLLAALASLWKRWPAIRAALRNPRVAATLGLTALLIAGNWLIYIWAVINNHVLEGSLGYYLNPLVNVLLGVVLLKERLTRPQMFAVALAAAGVAVLAAGAGEGLWISLTLAASFATYGFLRKVTPVESIEGLAIETAILTPVALGWLIWLERAGEGSLLNDPLTDALLVLAGAATAIPLLLFTAAAKRLPYSTLGFLQYIAPSLQFLLAVLVFGEVLTTAHIVCFGAIWTALVIFAVEGVRTGRAAARARRAALATASACVEPCSVP
ncbi:MAG TPA: EamA family transporter RarD [Allosphingosinicella sp.]|jgi:chloramphenicol-sensitive protein RarD